MYEPYIARTEYPLHNSDDNFADLFVDCISCVHAFRKPNVLYDQNQAFTHITVGLKNGLLKCKLDAESQINVIPLCTYKQLGIADR